MLLIAGGLQGLGVSEGDCVCILMRNDIAFLEASYAVMLLGAYAVQVNWHFKPEEVDYILKDTRTRVLIGHADLLNTLGEVIPGDITLLSVPTPAEIEEAYRRSLAPRSAARRGRSRTLDAPTEALRWPEAAAAAEHDLHVRHHRAAQGRT